MSKLKFKPVCAPSEMKYAILADRMTSNIKPGKKTIIKIGRHVCIVSANNIDKKVIVDSVLAYAVPASAAYRTSFNPPTKNDGVWSTSTWGPTEQGSGIGHWPPDDADGNLNNFWYPEDRGKVVALVKGSGLKYGSRTLVNHPGDTNWIDTRPKDVPLYVTHECSWMGGVSRSRQGYLVPPQGTDWMYESHDLHRAHRFFGYADYSDMSSKIYINGLYAGVMRTNLLCACLLYLERDGVDVLCLRTLECDSQGTGNLGLDAPGFTVTCKTVYVDTRETACPNQTVTHSGVVAATVSGYEGFYHQVPVFNSSGSQAAFIRYIRNPAPPYDITWSVCTYDVSESGGSIVYSTVYAGTDTWTGLAADYKADDLVYIYEDGTDTYVSTLDDSITTSSRPLLCADIRHDVYIRFTIYGNSVAYEMLSPGTYTWLTMIVDYNSRTMSSSFVFNTAGFFVSCDRAYAMVSHSDYNNFHAPTSGIAAFTFFIDLKRTFAGAINVDAPFRFGVPTANMSQYRFCGRLNAIYIPPTATPLV